MTLIDGKAISAQIKQEIAEEVAQIVANGGKRPWPTEANAPIWPPSS